LDGLHFSLRRDLWLERERRFIVRKKVHRCSCGCFSISKDSKIVDDFKNCPICGEKLIFQNQTLKNSLKQLQEKEVLTQKTAKILKNLSRVSLSKP